MRSDSTLCLLQPSDGLRPVSHSWPLKPVILMGDKVIPSRTATRLPVHVTDTHVGSDVLCLKETMGISRLGVESALLYLSPQ